MTERERKSVLIGAVVIALGLGVRGVPVLTDKYRQLRTDVDQSQALLARAEALVGAEQSLRDGLSVRASDIVALAPLLIGSGSRAEGVAAIGASLQGWAASYGVTVARLESARDSSASGFTRLSVDMEMESDLEGLLLFIAHVERDGRLLSLEELSVENSGGEGDGTAVLRSNLRVSGWIMGGEGI